MLEESEQMLPLGPGIIFVYFLDAHLNLFNREKKQLMRN